MAWHVSTTDLTSSQDRDAGFCQKTTTAAATTVSRRRHGHLAQAGPQEIKCRQSLKAMMSSSPSPCPRDAGGSHNGRDLHQRLV
jgi:hypothetical protein